VLGYNQKKWDSGQELAAFIKYWNELSQTQREAATVLGYSKRKWDDSSDSNNDSDG
jgi:hypothetical protein